MLLRWAVRVVASQKQSTQQSFHTNPHLYEQSPSTHTHTVHTWSRRENEQPVMLSSDIYLSNPISLLPRPPIHTSPPCLTQSCRSGLFLYICQSETCRGGRQERGKEMDGWRGAADVCWTTQLCLTKTWQSRNHPVKTQINHCSAVT